MPSEGSIERDLAYVFLVFARRDADREHYRQVRASILQTYCLAILHDHRELRMCVGLAVGALSDVGSSEDVVSIEQMEWTPVEVQSLNEGRAYYEVLDPSKLERSSFPMQEFPADPDLAGLSRQLRRALERARRKRSRH